MISVRSGVARLDQGSITNDVVLAMSDISDEEFQKVLAYVMKKDKEILKALAKL